MMRLLLVVLLGSGAHGFVARRLPSSHDWSFPLLCSQKEDQEPSANKSFAEIMRKSLSSVERKVEYIRKHCKSLVGTTIESFETAQDWWACNGTTWFQYHDYVYAGQDGLSFDHENLLVDWEDNNDEEYRLFCSGQNNLQVQWSNFDHLYLSNEPLVSEYERKDEVVDEIAGPKTVSLEYQRWKRVEEMQDLSGRQIQAIYLGCCENYCSDTTDSVDVWNVLLFDLGDVWLEISNGLGENWYELHYGTPKYRLIKCA